MQSPTGSLARALALVLGLAFVLMLPLTLLGLAWGKVLFSPQAMTDILAQELIDSRALQRAAVGAFLERSGPQQADNPDPDSLQFLDRQDLDRLVETLFPTEWAHDQMRANIEIFYAWIDSDLSQPEFRLDVQPIKESLQSGGAEDLVTTIVDSWPVCSAVEAQQLERELLASSEFPSLTCEPPEPLRGQLVAAGTELLLAQAGQMPSSAPIGGQNAGGEGQQGSEQLKRLLRVVRELSDAGWMLPASLLGLIVALAVRSWPGLLRWWGAPLTGAGVSSFLTLVISRGIAQRAQDSAALSSISGGSLDPVLRGVMGRLLDEVGGRMFLYCILLIVSGLVMLLVGLWLKRRSSRAV